MRAILLGAAMASLICTAVAVPVQGYPTHAVTAIAAFPPGSPGDFIMRLIGERFNADLKQNLVVDNHAGAAATSRPNW